MFELLKQYFSGVLTIKGLVEILNAYFNFDQLQSVIFLLSF